MAITTRDGLIGALANNSSRFVIDKLSQGNASAGQTFSLWTVGGVPGAGANPTTAAVPTNATAGCIRFPNQTAPATSYLAYLATNAQTAGSTLEIHDRLAHMGGLSGTVTTAQGALDLTVTNPGADRRGAADYSDIQWWLEWYTDTGATNVNATVNVTYNDGTTGNLAAIALGATARRARMFQLYSAVAGKYIRAVNSVTLSATTGTAGNFGITATRPVAIAPTLLANKAEIFDWAQLGLPNIPNGSCLMMIVVCNTTSTGVFRCHGKIAHG